MIQFGNFMRHNFAYIWRPTWISCSAYGKFLPPSVANQANAGDCIKERQCHFLFCWEMSLTAWNSLKKETKEKLLLVKRNVKRLNYLIEQLLDVRRAEKGKLKVKTGENKWEILNEFGI